MPNYKYQCSGCGHSFVEFQGISEARLVDCPSCKKPALKRLIGGGSSVVFKGSGFYSTDYKKKSSGKSGQSDAPCASCGSAKDNGGPCPADSGKK